jgi:carboxyl-terminal processing protease
VRLKQFQAGCAEELEPALSELETQGMQTLILDLRSNPGGLLNAGVEVADRFLGKGKLIVYTEGRSKKHDMRFMAHEEFTHPDYPLVILIDQGSAGSSEIVAAALQEHRRALILGTKSYGRGSLQSVIPLSDNSALRLTTAYFFTPEGRKIDQTGIIPDVIITTKEEEIDPALIERPVIVVKNTDKDEELEVAVDIIRKAASDTLDDFLAAAREVGTEN